MRFSAIVVSALMGLAAASPNALAKRENEETTKAIEFAAQQADCDIGGCAAVIGAAACIGASIFLGPAGVASALACVSGGAAAICPCAPCVASLGDFLADNNICPDE